MKELRLRAVEPEDVDFILECENDAQAWRWSDYKAPLSRSQLMTYALTYDADPFSAKQLRLIAEYDGKPVGIADLFDISAPDSRSTAGIAIHPDFRHHGYGGKTLAKLKEYCSGRLGLRQITAEVATENKAALSLFEKEGFQRLCTLPSWHRIGPLFHDFILFSCLL